MQRDRQMLREIKETTERELKLLEKIYKENYHYVDKTTHYKYAYTMWFNIDRTIYTQLDRT